MCRDSPIGPNTAVVRLSIVGYHGWLCATIDEQFGRFVYSFGHVNACYSKSLYVIISHFDLQFHGFYTWYVVWFIIFELVFVKIY